jgi:hypothetical protein
MNTLLKQKQTLTSLAMLGLSLAFADAQSTVTFSAAIGQPNVFWQGVPVANQNEVRIGYFDSGFDISGHLNDLNAMSSAFNLYGSTEVTTILGIQEGSFTGTATKSDPATASLYEGQKIYLWIFKTANDSAPAQDYSNVLGYGLYSSTANTWVFPNVNGANPTGNGEIFTSGINQSLYGSFDETHLYLTPVPEPPTVALAVVSLGALFLVMRRKGKLI